jgi:hypothetical protein
MTMKTTLRAAVIVAAGCLIAASAAHAQALSVVNVNAPAVNCVFNNAGAPDCKVVVEDTIGTFTLPKDTGEARLQSRTYPGAAGAPAAGDMAYVYRVDLTNVKGATCVSSLTLFTGAVVKLRYSPPGNSDVFVVTSGGLGIVGPMSAVKTGDQVFFEFSNGPAGTPVCPSATSYFFGFASTVLKAVASTAATGTTCCGTAGSNPNVAARTPVNK